MMNKKGQIGENLIQFVILAFIILIVFGFVVWFFQNITDALVGMPDDQGAVNMSEAAAVTFGQVNAALLPASRILSFIILFGMIFAMLIVEFLSRKSPVYFFIDFLIVIFAIVISVILSNRYEEMLVGLPFSSTLISLRAGSSLILNLPRWVTVIGLIGMLLSFIGIIRRRGTEEFT